jgi:hypothetical protein
MAIPIQSGVIPEAGKIELDPDSGRYQIFNPAMGSDGEFVQASLAELQAEKARDPNFNLPFNYAFGQTPEGKVRTKDPNTGLLLFTDPVPDPAAMSPDELQRASNIAALGNFIDPITGQIRDEFAGGDLPSIDVIRDQDPATLAQTIEGLKNREKGRLTGFKGEFTDLAGGEGLENFLGAVGTRGGFVDPYGQKTQIGMQEDLFKDPQSAMIQGTFDEQKYLRDFPDVAAAVARGDFASGKEHFDTFGSREQRDVYYKGGTVLDLEEIQTKPDEFLDSNLYDISPTTGQITAETGTAATIADPTKTGFKSFTADRAIDLVKAENMQAAKQLGLTDIVTAQTDTVEKQATVQGQLETLMTQFEGGQVPAWAAGAIRNAEQRLASRGMGASSMAGAAIVQAAMEAATPIAAADAQTYRSMQELNLNNRQQAEVLNAQMTMQLDLANLNNEQQARVTNTSNRVQSLFRDQAAVNASKQFNAANEQQNDQFFASLFNNANQFKAAQSNAMERFNAGQENAVEQFNSSLQNTREQFNAKNAILIDQANAVYRRNINTANTALRNAENEFNVRNLFNISQTALNNLLQEDRDKVNFARVNSLNDTAFKNQLALTSFSFDKNIQASRDIARGAQRTRLVDTVVGGVVDFVFS